MEVWSTRVAAQAKSSRGEKTTGISRRGSATSRAIDVEVIRNYMRATRKKAKSSEGDSFLRDVYYDLSEMSRIRTTVVCGIRTTVVCGIRTHPPTATANLTCPPEPHPDAVY